MNSPFNIEAQLTQLNDAAKQRQRDIINAYKTGYFDCAAMFAMQESIDSGNVRTEMEIGLKNHLGFVAEMQEPQC